MSTSAPETAPDAADYRTFEALGTYVWIGTTGDPEYAARRAGELLAEVDRTCSRFRADSDLNRANRRAGSWTRVDPLLVAAVDVAREAARLTDGLVDPCLGIALTELGYDIDLNAVRARGDRPAARISAPRPGAWQEIETDPAGGVLVPAGVRLDLGSTAKAWASDLVALTLLEETGHSVLVSLGGDIRIAGPEPVGAPWAIEITEHPGGEDDTRDPVPAETVWLDEGGLATSSTRVRRWTHGGVLRHHLLDPRTGLPADEFWRTATCTGPTAVAANVASTAAIVLGAAAPSWLTEHQVDARLVSRNGSIQRICDWPEATPPLPEENHA